MCSLSEENQKVKKLGASKYNRNLTAEEKGKNGWGYQKELAAG